MIVDKIKIRVSPFVSNIIENDALCFGFTKNEKSNKNALLNKLIPTLLATKKAKREAIEKKLKFEYNRMDAENIYNAVNMVIDQVYFNDGELNDLTEEIWIRPSKNAMSTFNEIENSEIKITAQELSVYIRGLLNEYCRLPAYKREQLIFDQELDVFYDASISGQILHFTDKETGEQYKVLAAHTYYGYTSDQTNVCIVFDIKNNQIKALPLYKIQDPYTIKQKFKPSKSLLNQLQTYVDSNDFEKIINVENI